MTRSSRKDCISIILVVHYDITRRETTRINQTTKSIFIILSLNCRVSYLTSKVVFLFFSCCSSDFKYFAEC